MVKLYQNCENISPIFFFNIVGCNFASIGSIRHTLLAKGHNKLTIHPDNRKWNSLFSGNGNQTTWGGGAGFCWQYGFGQKGTKWDYFSSSSLSFQMYTSITQESFFLTSGIRTCILSATVGNMSLVRFRTIPKARFSEYGCQTPFVH